MPHQGRLQDAQLVLGVLHERDDQLVQVQVCDHQHVPAEYPEGEPVVQVFAVAQQTGQQGHVLHELPVHPTN